MTRFGSRLGMALRSQGKVEICSTPNQDNPLMPSTGCGGTPILGLDVWEHAYYPQLSKQKGRLHYSLFDVVN